MRCILKSCLLTFIEWTPILSCVKFWVCTCTWNNIFMQKIYSRIILKFGWYSKELNFTNGIRIFNYEFVYLMILNIWDITDMKICKRNFKTKIHNIFRTRGVSIVPPICVGTKIPSITEERLSRNRRIGPGALEKIFKFLLFRIRQRILCVKYCWNWPSGSGKDDFSYFSYFVINYFGKGPGYSFE